MDRRRFLGAAAAAALGTACGRPPAKPPHIVLIVDDQHHPRALGHRGAMGARTEALDALARQSVVFHAAYCASPMCGPARHSLHTGHYASRHGSFLNDIEPRDDLVPVARRLGDAGYTTASIGKLHATPYHARFGFHYVLHHEYAAGPQGISHYFPWLQAELRRRGLARPARPAPTLAMCETDWLPEELTSAHWVTDQALALVADQIERRPGARLFLHVGYFPPHPPYSPLPAYLAAYPPDDVVLPPNFDLARANLWWREALRSGPVTARDVQVLRAHYLACVTQLDVQIGRLVAGIDRLLPRGDVLLIFTSDHGDALGEHGLFTKSYMWEASVGVPLMIRHPLKPAARVEPAPVSHLDLAPTLLAAAGLPADPALPGDDLGPLVLGSSPAKDRAVHAEMIGRKPFTSLMVRRGTLKLWIEMVGRSDVVSQHLFDVANDPWELRDLSGDPAHHDALVSLRAMLDDRWRDGAPLAAEERPFVPRRAYRISWPADPWAPVEPA